MLLGPLICTLISENQGLEKSIRPISNPRNISGSANLDFFQFWYKPSFFQVGDLVKNLRFTEPENCLWFEIDLLFSRP